MKSDKTIESGLKDGRIRKVLVNIGKFFSSFRVIMLLTSVILIIVPAMLIIRNPYYDIIGRYKTAMCVVDLHKFKSDNCPECGRKITESGVFYRVGEEYRYSVTEELPRLNFADYFNSYDDYSGVKDGIFALTIILIAALFNFIFWFWFMLSGIIKKKRSGKL